MNWTHLKPNTTMSDYISLPTDVTDTASSICNRAAKVSASRNKRVRFSVSGIQMECGPEDDGDELFSHWWSLWKEEEKKKALEAQRAFDHAVSK